MEEQLKREGFVRDSTGAWVLEECEPLFKFDSDCYNGSSDDPSTIEDEYIYEE